MKIKDSYLEPDMFAKWFITPADLANAETDVLIYREDKTQIINFKLLTEQRDTHKQMRSFVEGMGYVIEGQVVDTTIVASEAPKGYRGKRIKHANVYVILFSIIMGLGVVLAAVSLIGFAVAHHLYGSI